MGGNDVPLFGTPWEAGRYGADKDYRETDLGHFTQENWGTIQQVTGKQLYAAGATHAGGQPLEKKEQKGETATVHSVIGHEHYQGFTQVGFHYSHIRPADLIRPHRPEIDAANTIAWARFVVVAAQPRAGSSGQILHQGYDGKTQTFIEDWQFP
jgi:hypothetical protein